MELCTGGRKLKADNLCYTLCRYRFKRLPFRLSYAGDLFQAKIDETFADMQDFAQGIADDILVVGFKVDGSDHDAALDAVCK